MTFKEFVLRNLIGLDKVSTEKQNVGVIGHYDSKPYHNFRYALIYANEVEIMNTKEIEVFSRVYKGTTFVNVLVNDEKNLIDLNEFKYENIKPLLLEKGVEATDRSVVVVMFQYYNQKTVDLACSFYESNKHHFEQALIYNARLVQMDYYKPVPVFYGRMYQHFSEDLFFDLAFLDETEKDR